jgi:hypothetical protein
MKKLFDLNNSERKSLGLVHFTELYEDFSPLAISKIVFVVHLENEGMFDLLLFK